MTSLTSFSRSVWEVVNQFKQKTKKKKKGLKTVFLKSVATGHTIGVNKQTNKQASKQANKQTNRQKKSTQQANIERT